MTHKTRISVRIVSCTDYERKNTTDHVIEIKKNNEVTGMLPYRKEYGI